MPLYANTTDQLGDSTGSGAAIGASTFIKDGISAPSSGTVTIETAVAIATNCITFVLICVIIWLLLHYGRRRLRAGLNTKEAVDTDLRKPETDRLPGPNSCVPTIYHQGMGPSFQNVVWPTPPSTLDSHRVARVLPMALPRVAESCYIPGVSPHIMPREVLNQRQQEIGPRSPSSLRDTEDCQSMDEERVNRVILEVARRMGGVERTGLPPDYADLH
jgi:hypothetical protein